MSLKAEIDKMLDDLHAGRFGVTIPPEVFASMKQATDELIASGAADRALRVGDRLPTFSLEDHEGVTYSSEMLLGEGLLILSFYRGVWCPYCNLELQALERSLPTYRELGAKLLAISPQSRANSRKSVRQNQLSFPILSDPRNEVAESFGLKFTLPDYLIGVYKSLKNNLPAFNGDDSWSLPMPARFVADRDGTVLYAEVNPDYTERPEPEELLPVLHAARLTACGLVRNNAPP